MSRGVRKLHSKTAIELSDVALTPSAAPAIPFSSVSRQLTNESNSKAAPGLGAHPASTRSTLRSNVTLGDSRQNADDSMQVGHVK